MGFRNIINTTRRIMDKHGANIATAAGLALFGATVYLAVKAVPKVEEILDEVDEQEEAGEEVDILEVGKKLVPAVAAPVATGVAAGVCFIASNRISAAKITSLMGMVTTMAEAKKVLEDYVKEKEGPKGLQAVTEKLVQKKVEEHKDEPKQAYVIETGLGNELCYDVYSGRLFNASWSALKDKMVDVNDQLLKRSSNSVTLNDIYRIMGLPTVDVGDSFEWYAEDGKLSLWRDAVITPTDQAAIRFAFDRDYHVVRGKGR